MGKGMSSGKVGTSVHTSWWKPTSRPQQREEPHETARFGKGAGSDTKVPCYLALPLSSFVSPAKSELLWGSTSPLVKSADVCDACMHTTWPLQVGDRAYLHACGWQMRWGEGTRMPQHTVIRSRHSLYWDQAWTWPHQMDWEHRAL